MLLQNRQKRRIGICIALKMFNICSQSRDTLELELLAYVYKCVHAAAAAAATSSIHTK